MPFLAKKIKVPGETDVERQLFLGLPMSICPEFVRKQLAIHARQQRRVVRLSDYIADALGQARPRESPYLEKGTLVWGKRQGWMTWEIPGQPKSKMLAFFDNGQLQKLCYDGSPCSQPVELQYDDFDFEIEPCGGQYYKSLFKLNGKMEAGSYCKSCATRENAADVCWCGGCTGRSSSGACWK
jgi:hypothetical protein